MKVILTEKVPHLGNVGEICKVSPGYGRNYLLKNSLAVIADDRNSKELEDQKRRLAKKVSEEKSAAEAIAKKLNGLNLEIVKKVGANGRLFGTVTNAELSKILADKEIEVERRLIVIENPIKSTGEFEIKAKLFSDVEANFKVSVIMDPKQAQEMKEKAAAAAAAKKKKKVAEEEKTDEATEESTEETVEA